MNSKRANPHSHKPDLQSARNLILTLAVSSTIGFWAIFSRVDASQFTDGSAPTQTTDEALFLDGENQMVVNLPPIPTLVPVLDPALAGSIPAGNLSAPSTIASVLPTPSLIKPPKVDNGSVETGEKVVKPRKSKDQGTSTRSS